MRIVCIVFTLRAAQRGSEQVASTLNSRVVPMEIVKRENYLAGCGNPSGMAWHGSACSGPALPVAERCSELSLKSASRSYPRVCKSATWRGLWAGMGCFVALAAGPLNAGWMAIAALQSAWVSSINHEWDRRVRWHLWLGLA